MNRKNIPLLLMLIAGAVTCVIMFVKGSTVQMQLFSLLIVLLVFYLLGNVLKWTLDYFDKQNASKEGQEGEVIEKVGEQGTEPQSKKEGESK